MGRCGCEIAESESQPFPETGALFDQMNCDLEDLREKISWAGGNIVYSYIIATIKLKNSCFVQTGSAPNFQGERITLCTCKHFMRTFQSKDKWKGKWIAGFSGVNAGNGRNTLVYLMRVGQAYDSHYDFWNCKDIPMKTKLAKAADRSRFGDLYRPNDKPIDHYSYRSYEPPIKDHVHISDNAWRQDINYVGRSGRKASLLIGDPGSSFLWNCPMIYSDYRLHRGQRKITINALLDELRMYK